MIALHRSFPRLSILLFCVSLLSLAGCQQSMVTRAETAAGVLRGFATSEEPIPRETLASAEAIAVLRETEASAVVGAGGGQGLLVQRTGKGWSAPIALDSSSGSFGAQIGSNSRDVVLVFRSKLEVEKIIRDGAYSVADASATFGPSHGSATETGSPVLTFVRVSGLFAGARIGGVGFSVNTQVNRETYGMAHTTEDILAGRVDRPLGTMEFFRLLPEPTPRPGER